VEIGRVILAMASISVLAMAGFWFSHRQGRVSPKPAPTVSGDPAASSRSVAIGPQQEVSGPQEPKGPPKATVSRSASGDALIQAICGPQAERQLRELANREVLTRSECETLYRFLRERTPDDGSKRMSWIKNDVMNILARQRNLPAPWDEMVAALYEDELQPWVIRDYALQHLFDFCDQASRTGHLRELNAARRQRIQALFWNAVEQTQQSVAGTALLALWRLSAVGMGVDRERVAAKSIELVEAPNTGELARITALQVSADSGQQGILKSAMALAEAGQKIPLRASAIAAVGRLGNQEQLPWLERQAADANPSLKIAVDAAVKQIRSRSKG